MFNQYTDLVQVLMDSMNLNDLQRNELKNPQNIVMRDPKFEALSEFFKHASKLIVCGDYDCDGVCSTSIAVLMAKKLKLDVGYYIPNRITEGYGVSTDTIQMAYDKGYKDVLIIDNGVKSFEPIALAHELGMNLAIIDHHLITEPIQVDAILHPDYLSDYGASMCAAGLIYALSEYMGLDDDYMLSLAALATVGDVMPLWGKNREIVRRGTKALQDNTFPHFDLLVKRSRFTNYSSKLLAFQIVPKINSVGRLADRANINTLVQYFTSTDHASITNFSNQILRLNEERKDLGKSYFSRALSQVKGDDFNIIVSDDFHEGLLGIVANQVLVETKLPTLVLRDNGTVLKGSARSNGISLAALFEKLDPDYFLSFGGHDFAFGVSIKKDSFEDFKKDLLSYVSKVEVIEIEENIVDLDASLINKNALDELRSLQPFGNGIELPALRIQLPFNKSISKLGLFGYKYTFSNFNINEAVYFNTEISQDAMESAQSMVGSLDLDSLYRVSFFVDSLGQ